MLNSAMGTWWLFEEDAAVSADLSVVLFSHSNVKGLTLVRFLMEDAFFCVEETETKKEKSTSLSFIIIIF